MSLSQGSLTAAFSCVLLTCYQSEAKAQPSLLQSELAITEVVGDYDLTGAGILVALIGEGVDFQLDDFRHSDGSTRIESILDLTNNAGAADPDNPIDRGTVYTKEEIQLAIDQSENLGFVDRYGSATTVTGIIAGHADDDTGRPFRGLAPEASLLIVKAHSLGVPGDQAAFNQNPELLRSALEYVEYRADSLSMPTVVFIGSQTLGGPTDGTSRVSALIDEYSRTSHPRMIFVTTAGDVGGIANHLAGSVEPGSEVSIEIDKNQEQSVYFDLWYPTYDSKNELLPTYEVTVTDADGKAYGPYLPGNPGAFISDRSELGVFALYHRSDDFDLNRAENGKRQLFVILEGKSGRYTITLSLASEASEAAAFQATLNSNFRKGDNPSEFVSNEAYNTVTDAASSEGAIVVNGYSLGAQWIDVNDQPQSDDPADGPAGGLLTSANQGTTFDGRSPVDFAAPAGSLFGPAPTDSYIADESNRLSKDGLGRYAAIQENQVAAALTTGIVALMLQIDPQLSANEAKAHFAATAETDDATGQNPAAGWGAGKMDASAAIYRVALFGSVKGESPVFSAFAPGEAGPRQISLQTDSNFTYTLQYREKLEAGAWTDVGETVAGTGEVHTFTVQEEDETISETGFFRICIAQAGQ